MSDVIIRGVVPDITERESAIRAREDSLLVVVRADVGDDLRQLEAAETLSSLTCAGGLILEVRKGVITLYVIVTELVGTGGACGRGPTSFELAVLFLFFCTFRGRSCTTDCGS